MINAVHTVLYTTAPEEVRAFFRDVLEFPFVDVGDGWLVFALPPGEIGIHPTDDNAHHELYLMCDDVNATMKELEAKGVEFARPVSDQGWGLVTAIKLPGGSELGMYEPRHPMPIKTR
jgi:predicted enzyme related to lactoylglutathione lyase